ncbi:hypothetical protein D3C81_2168820 [compost metagenome]
MQIAHAVIDDCNSHLQHSLRGRHTLHARVNQCGLIQRPSQCLEYRFDHVMGIGAVMYDYVQSDPRLQREFP